MQKFDVAIVGAGPAGLECARKLKNKNLSVAIFEKNKIIGPKICAGGLTGLAENFDFPAEKTRSFLRHQIFFDKKIFEINLRRPIRTISQHDLGQHQFQKIKNSKNIKIFCGAEIKKISEKKIVTQKNEKFGFKFLVGADGANSAVRKFLNLPAKFCVGICQNFSEIREKICWRVDPQKIPAGYFWIFPHQKFTNYGIYFDPKILHPAAAQKNFSEFLAAAGKKFSAKKVRAAAVNFNFCGCEFGEIFLVGDAAGLASRGTGEGISFALISGAEIARKILDKNYALPQLRRILKIKKKQELALRIFKFFPAIFQKFFLRILFFLLRKKWAQKFFEI